MSEPAPGLAGESTETLFEQAPAGVVLTTPEGVVVRANETFATLTGLTREQLVGARFSALLGAGGQFFFEERLASVLHVRGEVRAVALDLRHGDGEPVPVLVNAVVVSDAGGAPAGIRFAVFEYGERRGYERELLEARRSAEASEARLRVLHGASERLSETDTEEQLAEELAACAREAFTAPIVCVYLRDDAGGLTLAAGESPLDAELLAEGGPVERALVGLHVVVVGGNAASQPSEELATSMRAARVETVVVVPVLEAQRKLGVGVLAFRRARRFESEDADLAMTLGRQAAEVLGRLRAERVLERLALYDEVSGLPSRRLIMGRTNEVIDESRANGRPMAVVSVAVDGFHLISDRFGRGAAEDVVAELGERLVAAVGEGDLVGRFGAAEFAIVCSDTDARTVESLAEGLLTALVAPLRAGDGSATVTSTIGAAVYAGGPARASAQALFESAGGAMYRARELGTNRAAVATVE